MNKNDYNSFKILVQSCGFFSFFLSHFFRYLQKNLNAIFFVLFLPPFNELAAALSLIPCKVAKIRISCSKHSCKVTLGEVQVWWQFSGPTGPLYLLLSSFCLLTQASGRQKHCDTMKHIIHIISS